MSFLRKVYSEIIDYSMLYDLVQFQYDLWLYHTVSGVVSCGSQYGCSPARALETKSFCNEYWRWQHRFLLDALRQHGFPTLFITISPYEWSFPLPVWLQTYRQNTGRGPTDFAAFETAHIAHVLEQVVRFFSVVVTTQGGRTTN